MRRVTLIPGDGVGPEIVEACRRVIEATGIEIDWDVQKAGADVMEEYADRTVVLKDGSILLDGPTRSVFADEDRLAETSLRPSPIVQLSNWLGTQALTVKQLIQELKG